jgi:3'-phosphoadenosine 5'-phosphosulfate sulfotransferase (PAPS reductase)/FAD synthetase
MGQTSVIPEPILAEEDRSLWQEVWVPAFLAHVRTQGFRKRHTRAKEIAALGLSQCKTPCVYVSGGKDSTALGELIFGELGLSASCASEKDDLDYPGEEAHIEALAERWGVAITVLRPTVSLAAVLGGMQLAADEEIHSRLAAFSREFYSLLGEHNQAHDGIVLGLRAKESKARFMDRLTHGPLYRTKAGHLRICPLADWTGLDVLSYITSRGAPLLPLYRCVAFMHSEEPWRIRKSWWVPGGHSRFGGIAWLRHYYPSLYRKLRELMPGADRFT